VKENIFSTRSKNIFMTFDPYVLIKYHLYLLQLENYELPRFWALLLKKGWFPKGEQRKNLVWTTKAKLLFGLAEILILALAAFLFYKGFFMPFAYWWQKALTFLVTVYVLDFFAPIFLSAATILIWPADFFTKEILILRARFKIKGLRDIKVIGIAGSYGKTTMKEVLKSVLSTQYTVLSTPESVNVPIGVARWILEKVDASTEILIVEMGEHYLGDVKQLCKITPPDIAVVTGINQAHLERMQTMESVVATIFEIVSNAKPRAHILLNADNALVTENYEKFVWPDNQVQQYTAESIQNRIFDPERLIWKGGFEEIGELEIKLLGEYALGDIDAAIKAAKILGLSNEDIKKGTAEIKPVEHRLQPIKSGGNILVIDDSYNGNPNGAAEAIALLRRFPHRRKIYITPGLVEMGDQEAEIHREIGRRLVGAVDIVILIKNSVSPYIEEGIKSLELGDGGRKPKVVWFNTALQAHQELKNILQPYDVVLFQNDWGDQYL